MSYIRKLERNEEHASTLPLINASSLPFDRTARVRWCGGWHSPAHAVEAAGCFPAKGMCSILRNLCHRNSRLLQAYNPPQKIILFVTVVMLLIVGQRTDYNWVWFPDALPVQEGEKSFHWAIQTGDNVSTHIGLPEWIGREIGMRVCRFVNEHDRWQKAIEARAILGRELTASQQQSYNVWAASCTQRLIFCKKRQVQIHDAGQVNRNCVSFELKLSDEPSQLTLSTAEAGATPYRLLLLCSQEAAATEVPSVLYHPVTQGEVATHPNNEPEEQQDEGSVDMEEGGREEDAYALEDERLKVNMECERDEEEALFILADSDDEVPIPAGCSVPVHKVKTFHLRPEWLALERKGLTDLPRHIKNCFISYHSSTQVWEGHYPCCRGGMSAKWGSSTKRTEAEAIILAIKAVLRAHVTAHPKDVVWRRQLDRLEAELATGQL